MKEILLEIWNAPSQDIIYSFLKGFGIGVGIVIIISIIAYHILKRII